MKLRKRVQRVISALLVALMVISVIPMNSFAAESETYQKITTLEQFTSGKYVMALDTGYAVGKFDDPKKSSPWVLPVAVTPTGDKISNPGDAIVSIDVDSATNEATITLSDGNKIAPKGGNTNGIIADDYKWSVSCESGKFVFAGQGADTVMLASNTDKGYDNKFRAYKNTTAPNYPHEFALYKLSEGSGSTTETTVAAPTASVKGAVESGTAISLSSATAGTQIYYTLDGSDPSKSENTARKEYTDTQKPVITEACKLKAVAVLGTALSAVQEISYTIKESSTTTAPVADGDKVVIYAPAYNKALSSTYESGSYYNKGTEVTVGNDSKVTGYTDAEIWTVIDNHDGTYSFSFDGKNIGMADDYTSMSLGGKNDKWSLEAAADGTWYMKNQVREKYVEWYDGKSYWSAYAPINTGSEGMFQLKFYKVAGTATAPETPETTPVANGDKVVIYAPVYNKALSSEYSGFYNKGTDVTVDKDGKVSGYTDADVWTVVANQDGTYSFTYGGKNFAMGDSYSSTPLGEKNDKWSLEVAADETWYVKNTERKMYIEWYADNSNWSAYKSIGSGKEGMFQLKFYKVTGTTGDAGSDVPTVEGLAVEASPKSGASVESGQKITLTAATGAQIYYTMSTDGTTPADPDVTQDAQKYTAPITIANTPAKDKPVVIKAVAYIPAAGSVKAQTGEVYTLTYKAPMSLGDYNLYFGQLHAHTNLSDGTGTVAQAYEHAATVANLDYLALTDHSNSFDGASTTAKMHLGDSEAETVSADWHEGREGARTINAKENGTFIGLYGFEMTWSGGSPGHINTFNSQGFESRNLAPYKKGDNYKVLQAYYDTLNENPETMSQFNHPGDTFGDFMDFALYDTVIDNQMTMIEVGNGEGAIGASGYFPSYSYYTRALDKGWHVAPTNNQDNHKGNWGDSNTARSVVLASDLSEESIYDAMKNYRVYATEDNDLSILYSLNGNAMGSILDKQENVKIEASIKDPTDTNGSTKVEVIVNGGKTLAEQTFEGGSADITFDNLSANYGYYYLRITQADKNIAVTAPVWVGESTNAGISKTASDVALPIKGDNINISSQIYNNLGDDMKVTSLTYTMEGQSKAFHTADVSKIGTNGVIGARTSYTYQFPYEAAQAGGYNINVEMKTVIGGEEYTFTDVLKLSVSDPSITTKVLIDGTHYNDYVNGYYSGNMGNFINMGTADNIQVRIAQPGEKLTAESLKDVALFVISAPLKYTSDYTGEAQVSTFEDSFVTLVKDYVANGGTVVVCGLADYQDSDDGKYTSYDQANKVLSGIGSTMRINDDELLDQDKNGGSSYRLYFDKFNTESKNEVVQQVLKGVTESKLPYSSYSGCSVSVGKGEAVVYGHDTTYSINSKAPANGHDKPVLSYKDSYDEDKVVVKKGDVVSMATETVGKGQVFVTGTVFCSNFEVSSEDQVSYSNGIIAQNILDMVQTEPKISTIEEARAGKAGEVFTVEGTVAIGTAETGNAFFNTIYIQDEKGNGINVFPIDDNTIRRGDRVRITGTISDYLGDIQLSAINVTVLDGTKDVVITDTTTKEANDYDKNFGKLVRVKGTVKSVKLASGIVESIEVVDASGEACRVFIDGYVDYSNASSQKLESIVKAGANISAVGFVSHDSEGNRLRVRDRSEIKLEAASIGGNPGGDNEGNPGGSNDGSINQTDGDNTTTDWTAAVEQLKGADKDATVTIQVDESGAVSKNIFSEIKGTDKTVVLDLGNGIKWTIKGKDIKNIPEKDLNLKITLDSSDIPENVIKNSELSDKDVKKVIQMSLEDNPDFGFSSSVLIPVGKEFAGKYANLYYFNPKTNKLEGQMSALVGQDGYAAFVLSHASDYAISITDKAALSTSPKMGDNNQAAAYILLLVLGAAMLMALEIRKRKVR